MVNGRFGSANIASQTTEVQPSDISQPIRSVPGRFGRSQSQTKELQEKAEALREIRNEAINIASKFDTFASQSSVENVEVEFSKLSPLVKQFVKITPSRKQIQVEQTIERLKKAREEALQKAKTSTDSQERFRQEQIAEGISRILPQAQTGQFTFQELLSAGAEQGVVALKRQSQKQQFTEKLIQQGVPSDLAKRIINRPQTKITFEEARSLSPEARRAIGVEIKQESEQQRLERAILSDPTFVGSALGGGFLTREGGIARVVKETPEGFVLKIEGEASRQQVRTVTEFKEPEGFFERKIFEIGRQQSRLETENIRNQNIQKKIKITLLQIEKAGFKSGQSVIEAGKTISPLGAIENIKIIDRQLKKLEKTSLKEQVIKVKELKSKEVATQILDTEKIVRASGQQLGIKLRTQPERVIGQIIFETALTLGVPKFIQFTKEEIIIAREAPKEARLSALTEIKNLRQAEKSIDIGKFTIVGVKEGRQGFAVTRLEKLRGTVVGGRTPKDLTISEASLRFKGRVVDIEKPSAVLLKTEPFIIKEGEIVKSALRDSDAVAFVSQKSTLSKDLTKATRGGSLKIGKVGGVLDKELKELRLVDTNKLSKLDAKLINEAKKITESKGLRIETAFGKEAKASGFNVISQDVLKLTKREQRLLSLEQRARTTRRGRGAIISESKLLTQFEREFGLKETEILSEKISVADITKRLGVRETKLGFKEIAPRKVTKLEGITIRKEFELPSGKTPSFIEKFTKPQRTKTKLSPTAELKLQELKLGGAFKATKELKGVSNINKALTKTTTQIKTPSFAFPRVSQKEITKEIQLPKSSETTIVGTKNLAKTSEKQLTKLNAKEVEKLIGKTSTTTKLTNKLIDKQITKQFSKLNLKLVPRISTPVPPRTLGIPKFARTPTPPPAAFSIPRSKRRKKKTLRMRNPLRDDSALVEGFTARALKLPPLVIREKDLSKALKQQSFNLGIRRRPIVIPNMKLPKKITGRMI